MEPLRICLFGCPRIERVRAASDESGSRNPALGVAGRHADVRDQAGSRTHRVEVSRRKAMALIAYLAAADLPVRREFLSTLLWPDCAPDAANAYLRNALWIVRRTPLGPALDLARDSVRIVEQDDLQVDVRQFRALLGRGRHTREADTVIRPEVAAAFARAVELAAAPFLEGFSLEDGEGFNQWRDEEAERLRRDLAFGLEALVRFHAARRRFDAAIGYAHRWQSLDPFDERVLRHRMLLQARCGRGAVAEELYEDAARRLRSELGCDPGPETRRLRARIRAGDVRSEATGGVSARRSSGVPASLTPFFGRGEELERIREWMARPGSRMVTIAGLGGCGKTRLAAEAATAMAPMFEDGAVFVSLAGVPGVDLLAATVLDALREAGILEEGQEPPRSESRERNARGKSPARPDPVPADPGRLGRRLAASLRHRHLFLVLDNFEHLVEGAPWVARLLGQAAGLSVLITSRERLGLRDEQVLELHGLDVPGHGAGPEDLSRCASVQLYLAAAARAGGKREPSGPDLEAAARICRLVDGLPLGLEIAASWSRAMTSAQIARAIEEVPGFLASSSADLPERQRSLARVFAHAAGRLSGDQRRAYHRLSVFPASFDVEGACAVTGASPSDLAALVDRALLRRRVDGRLEMFPLLRQHAAQGWESDPPSLGDRLSIIESHRVHYMERLARACSALQGERQVPVLHALLAEVDNVRAAWSLSIQRGRWEEVAAAWMAGFLLADISSRYGLGTEMFLEVLRCPDTCPDALAAHARAASGWFLVHADPEAGLAAMGEAISLLEELPQGEEFAFASVLFANAGGVSSDAGHRDRLAAAGEVAQRLGRDWLLAMVLDARSYVESIDDLPAAEACARESLKLFRRLGDPWGMSLALYSLARTLEYQGRLAPAQALYQESLQVRRGLGAGIDAGGVAICLLGLGNLALYAADPKVAAARFGEALEMSRPRGNRQRALDALGGLALATWAAGDTTGARLLLFEALVLVEELGLRHVAWPQGMLALIALDEGDEDEAERLGGDPRLSDCASFSSRLVIAWSAWRRGDHREAVTRYHAVLADLERRRDETMARVALRVMSGQVGGTVPDRLAEGPREGPAGDLWRSVREAIEWAGRPDSTRS